MNRQLKVVHLLRTPHEFLSTQPLDIASWLLNGFQLIKLSCGNINPKSNIFTLYLLM